MNIKLIIENTLQNIDLFFNNKSKKDINMVYIMIIALCFAIAYPLYDLSFDKFSATKELSDSLETKINADKLYLKVNPQEKLAQLNLDIAKLQKDLQETKDANIYIKDKIMEISSLIYNEKAWGEYLDSISKNAQKHNVKILDFKNKYVQSSESFGHVLDIDLDVRAKYSDIINFIGSLEQSELVVDLHNFSINAKDELSSKLNISVWGVTYK